MQRKSLLCAVMADGLGGHGGGAKASGAAVETIRENFRQLSDLEQVTKEQFDSWFEQANDSVAALQTAACQMKTTLAVLCANEDTGKATWAHLGDSRIYHFIDGKEVFCSFDHSVSRMAVLAGEITLDEVRFHGDRSKLLKVVGVEELPRPEFGSCTLEKKFTHAFLLCTDGFWEYVTEEEMEQTLQASGTPEEWLKKMCKILQTKVSGDNDNNSAVAIFFCEE